MNKKLTCTECPNGCRLFITVERGKVIGIEGAKCQKGEKYGINEIQNPVRELTSTVRAEGLSLKMIPVKTSQPVPKEKIFQIMEEICKITVTHSVKVSEVIIANVLNLNVDIIATRSVN